VSERPRLKPGDRESVRRFGPAYSDAGGGVVGPPDVAGQRSLRLTGDDRRQIARILDGAHRPARP